MKKLLLLLLIIPFLSVAQEKGIHFEHNSNWAKVKAKAKAENKHIFVDVFTTWCGPCKYMSDNIFPQEKVGKFFNEKFVNLKLQMDETEGDNEEVKSWREEAKRFAKDYSIAAYPTFLIFSPDGELVHRIVGGGEADDFIAKAGDGLNPETQFVTVLKKFEANPNDVATAKATAKAAEKAYDNKLLAKAVESIIANSPKEELLSNDNITLIRKSASGSTSSKAFAFLRENKTKIAEKNPDLKLDQILSSAIINSEIYPKVKASEEDILDQLIEEAKKKYTDIDLNPTILGYKPVYYRFKKNWPKFKDAVTAYLSADPTKVNEAQLNDFAWSIFENCDDKACIEAALAWSKKSLEKEQNPMFLDTYANLLYKSGKKKEAIETQEKALALVDDDSKADYQATLDKMKKGLPTWGSEEE